MLASELTDALCRKSILLPSSNVIERICAEAITRANRRIYAALTDSLSAVHRQLLDELLQRKEGSKVTRLAWLRQSPVKPNSRHMLEHIERLKDWQALDLPAGIERQVHQSRLLKIAREGGQITPADLARFEIQRRYATLVALAIEGTTTVTDEIQSTCTTGSSKSCSMRPKISISNSFKPQARPSTTRCACTGASARPCSKPSKVALTPSRPSNLSFPRMHSRPASGKRKSSRSLRSSISFTALARTTPRCAVMRRSFWRF